MIFLGQELDKNKPPFIVAELSCNHQGDTNQAIKLLQSARDAGADAVKIQVYTADDMTIDIKYPQHKREFVIENGLWAGNELYQLYQKTQTDLELAITLINYAQTNNIPIFASVFSQKSLSLLEEMKLQAYKIASFELVDLPLIRKVAKTGKSIVLSTGMASLEEIDEAVNCCNPANTALLHCVSAYPTKLEQANLWRVQWLSDLYPSCAIGFSDHTRGITAGPLACAMGARIIEKHIAIPETNPEDAAFSLHPDEFKTYVQNCKKAAEATFKTEVPEEQASRQFRRSLYAVKDIMEGEAFTPNNVRSIRPSYGLAPKLYNKLICGMRASREIKAGTALTKDMII
jgi:N-acetylneuraminate synthase